MDLARPTERGTGLRGQLNAAEERLGVKGWTRQGRGRRASGGVGEAPQGTDPSPASRACVRRVPCPAVGEKGLEARAAAQAPSSRPSAGPSIVTRRGWGWGWSGHSLPGLEGGVQGEESRGLASARLDEDWGGAGDPGLREERPLREPSRHLRVSSFWVGACGRTQSPSASRHTAWLAACCPPPSLCRPWE